MPEEITITKKNYKELVDDHIKLMALEGAGVDNWEGYEYAMEIYLKEIESLEED